MKYAVLCVALLAACGDNLTKQDAAVPIDMPLVDMPLDMFNPCFPQRYITGEVIEFDSTTANFMGVNNAVFTQRNGTATDTTSPNGRFEMCVPPTVSYQFDVNMPATHLDAIAYFDSDSAAGNVQHTTSFRAFTLARAMSFYTANSLTFDNTDAHVLVFLGGDTGAVMVGAAHDTPLVGNGGEQTGAYTWAPHLGGGPAGRYVLFPNVDETGGTTTLDGDILEGQHTIPLEAGKLTFVAISFVFVP